MDNKTLALLGLGAALTAFLSHQSFQSTGRGWFSSDPPLPAVTASSDSEPESVAAAESASYDDAESCSIDRRFRDALDKDCFGDCFKTWLNRQENQDLKNRYASFDHTNQNVVQDLYNRLDLLFPHCAFQTTGVCSVNKTEQIDCAKNRGALDDLFVLVRLSNNNSEALSRFRCIDYDAHLDTRKWGTSTKYKSCSQDSDCEIAIQCDTGDARAVHKDSVGVFARDFGHGRNGRGGCENRGDFCNECGFCKQFIEKPLKPSLYKKLLPTAYMVVERPSKWRCQRYQAYCFLPGENGVCKLLSDAQKQTNLHNSDHGYDHQETMGYMQISARTRHLMVIYASDYETIKQKCKPMTVEEQEKWQQNWIDRDDIVPKNFHGPIKKGSAGGAQ